jgi:subtilase family serine protease
MARFRLFPLSLSLVSLLILSTFAFATPPDRITGAIIPNQRVQLHMHAPLQAQPGFDKGPVDPSLQLTYVTLETVPSPAQQKALSKLLADQQDRRSPNYHKWLTVSEYADRFGLSSSDINKLTAWLKSQGFSIVRVANGRNWIAFSGTAAQVERTFNVAIHNFKVDGEIHFSNINPPSIPVALRGIVSGFRGLSDFPPKSNAHRAAAPGYTFTTQNGSYLFLAPGDIKTQYDLATLYNNGIDGTGQVIAIVGETGIYQSDLTNFRQNFGLSAINCSGVSGDIITSCNTSNFRFVLVEGSATTINSGVLPEADLDIEWSGATARNAQIVYVDAPQGGYVWDAWWYAIDNKDSGANIGESVINMSFTAPCELAEAGPGTGEGTIAGDEAELAMGNALGITFMNSSGDTGAAACDNYNITGTSQAQYGYAASYPTTSVSVTSVGGTSVPYTDFTQTYWGGTNGTDGGSLSTPIPEEPWNDSLEFAYFCEANKTNGFCTTYGIGAGPLNTDWENTQLLTSQGSPVIGISAGSGGMSNCAFVDTNGVCTGGFTQPSWQSGLNFTAINPSAAGQVNSTLTRAVPDVSLFASPNWPGYLICTQYSALGGTATGSSCDSPTTGVTDMLNACLVTGTQPCSIFGGTSVSSPIFAGMVALFNQEAVAQGLQATPGLGNINPTLYELAAHNATNGAFNQVTTPSTSVYSNGAWCAAGTPNSGVTGDPWPSALVCPAVPNNIVGFNSNNFDATTGYNLAVGLGSVNASHFAAALVSQGATTTTTVASSQNPSNYGDAVTFTATVTTNGANAPTGTVTFNDGGAALGSGTLGTPSGLSAQATFTTSTSTPLSAGAHSITAVYGGDSSNAGSTSSVLTQTVNPATFTFVSTGSASHTVLAGQSTLTYTFTATPTSGATFAGAVTVGCSFSPTDPTLPTNGSNVCSYQVNGGAAQAGSATIPAGSGTSTVTLTVTTAGPNTGTGSQYRRRSDNRMPFLPMTLPLAGVVLAGFVGRKRSKNAMVGSLCLALVMAGLLIACGSSSTPPIGVTVSGSSSSIYPQNTGWTNSTATFTANLTNDSSGKGVTWAVSPTLAGQSITPTDATHATYTPPTIASGLPSSVTITATSAADPSKSGNGSITLTPTTVPVNGGYTVTVTATETGAATPQTPVVTLVVN